MERHRAFLFSQDNYVRLDFPNEECHSSQNISSCKFVCVMGLVFLFLPSKTSKFSARPKHFITFTIILLVKISLPNVGGGEGAKSRNIYQTFARPKISSCYCSNEIVTIFAFFPISIFGEDLKASKSKIQRYAKQYLCVNLTMNWKREFLPEFRQESL